MPGMSMEAAPSTGVSTAGGARKLGRWLTRWWFRAPDGRVYQRRRADVLVAAAGLGLVIVCGVLVANRLLASPDVALFHRINHWPGWLYPPMSVVQLSGVIGAPPLLAAAGLGVVIACGVLVANRLLASPDVALFHRINHWPGWLYPPMSVVQLSGVIGAPPLLAAAAALLRRFRLAAALVAATLLKVSLDPWPRRSCSVAGPRRQCRT